MSTKRKGCSTVLWHIPFCGFAFSLVFLYYGIALCLTGIFIPAGIGYLNLGQFLFAPHNRKLISQYDLVRVHPDYEPHKGRRGLGVLNTILYMPIGLCLMIVMALIMAAEFVSLIGIPCGIVWAKTLSAFLLPVNRVCVSNEVAQLLVRLPRPNEIQGYSDERLTEIINHPQLYRAHLVDDCRYEREVRITARVLMPQFEEYSNEKIIEVLSDPDCYADEVRYCCQELAKQRIQQATKQHLFRRR